MGEVNIEIFFTLGSHRKQSYPIKDKKRWDCFCIIWHCWGPVMWFQRTDPTREHRWLVIFYLEVFSPYTSALHPKIKTLQPGQNPLSVSGNLCSEVTKNPFANQVCHTHAFFLCTGSISVVFVGSRPWFSRLKRLTTAVRSFPTSRWATGFLTLATLCQKPWKPP